MVTVKSVWVIVTVLAWVFLIAHLGHCSKLYVASPMNPLYHCSECSKTSITTALHKYPSKASQILWPEVQTLDYQRPWLLVSSLASPLSTQLLTPASTISFLPMPLCPYPCTPHTHTKIPGIPLCLCACCSHHSELALPLLCLLISTTQLNSSFPQEAEPSLLLLGDHRTCDAVITTYLPKAETGHFVSTEADCSVNVCWMNANQKSIYTFFIAKIMAYQKKFGKSRNVRERNIYSWLYFLPSYYLLFLKHSCNQTI